MSSLSQLSINNTESVIADSIHLIVNTELKDISGGMSVEKNRLKDLIVKNKKEKEKQNKERLLLKNRKEVDINKDGQGYTIKEGPNKGKVLAHIQIPSKSL